MQKGNQYQIKANPTVQEQYQEVQEIKQTEEPVRPKSKYYKPEFVTCKNYQDREEIIKAFPHLQSLADAEQIDFSKIENAYSYILRSNNDDDIHKAIKYGLWCSIPNNNIMLKDLFVKAQSEQKDIYLFYTVVKSGQFIGVAKLIKNMVDESFGYWWQGGKYKGYFGLQWLFVKDIQLKHFENLQDCNNQSVTLSKDGTQIDWQKTGQKMMQIFKEFSPDQNIFNDFQHMDQREQQLRYQRNSNNNNYYNNNNQNYNHNNYYQNYNYQQQYPNYMNYQVQMFQQIPQQMMGYAPQNYFQQQKRFNNIYPPNQQNGQHKNNYNQQQYNNNSQNQYNKNNNYKQQQNYNYQPKQNGNGNHTGEHVNENQNKVLQNAEQQNGIEQQPQVNNNSNQ